jgi:hypothetical protein
MLDQILSGLKQGLPSSGEQWWQSRLAQAVLSWVEGHGSGISGLVGRFSAEGVRPTRLILDQYRRESPHLAG